LVTTISACFRRAIHFLAPEVAVAFEGFPFVMPVGFQPLGDVVQVVFTVAVQVAASLMMNRLAVILGGPWFAEGSLIAEQRQFGVSDGRGFVAGGEELFKSELLKIKREIAEEVALEGIVAVAIDDLIAEDVLVEFPDRLPLSFWISTS
jgi:hypothetical protein